MLMLRYQNLFFFLFLSLLLSFIYFFEILGKVPRSHVYPLGQNYINLTELGTSTAELPSQDMHTSLLTITRRNALNVNFHNVLTLMAQPLKTNLK